ncbi:hypothetical protein SLEP1_g7150 [Rubroshorea leprosula]|uniref:non-specific serine/threonine protein kinase n=1 Tax=Rubroshorea leprosula TaxID=152421 RepID=A0AAV5I7D1_9ROSI|nr:hypothetical protein SLEP1_g7150 [Rubroshorea leprosula]
MGFNFLTGFIPPMIFNISTLECIYLGGNNLSGHLPSTIGLGLPKLTELELFDNKLNGIFPSSITNSSLLAILDLSNNLFFGPFPNSLGHLTSLQWLDLSQNMFSEFSTPKRSFLFSLINCKYLTFLDVSFSSLNGILPASIGNLSKSLQYLYASNCKIQGNIPVEIGNLSNLISLELIGNDLIGPIPATIGRLQQLQDFGNLKVLISMDLSRNQLSGNLPNNLGDLKALTHLFLRENALEGHIPQSFGGLVSLESLDLSNNILSGVIPKSLERLFHLKFFNVSFNKLKGEIPSGGSFKNFSAQSFMGNTALCGLPRFQVPPCKSRKKSIQVQIKLVSSLVAATVLILFLVILIFKRLRKSKAKSIDEEILLSLAKWKRISYHELQHATDKFNERNLLGRGSFGSVYYGTLPGGMNVAIKVFNLQVEGVLESFDTECEVLRSFRHRNLVKIISSCCNEDFKALVLEFMPNGTLEKWLHFDRCCLNVLQRLDIMIDVASALEYLHHGNSIPIVHCDLKPSNVLLDEDMVAHVGDFGLTKILGEGESMMQTMQIATIGYMAPEYGSLGMVSTKGDVYSYGILVMETFTRRKPTDKMFTGEKSLKAWVNESLSRSGTEVVDDNLMEEEEHFIAKANCVSSVLEVALNCCTEAPKERRDMMDVAVMLKKIKHQYLKDIGN